MLALDASYRFASTLSTKLYLALSTDEIYSYIWNEREAIKLNLQKKKGLKFL